MAYVLKREKNALQNLNFWAFEKGHQEPLQQLTYDLCITYYDADTINERDSKLYEFYKNTFYTDLVLKVQDETVAVHGIVLSSKSEYFQVMLQSAFLESSTRIIDFSTSFNNMAVLKLVVDYIYTGKVILRQNVVEQVLGAAQLYMLNRLKEHCAQFLLEQLQPQNALKTWRLAHLYDMTELEVICLALLKAVLTRHLIDKTVMQDFTPNCLSALLNCDELVQNLHYKDVADLIVVWLKAGEIESRKETAKILLLKYLKDQALDVILESIYNLSFYGQTSTSNELSPTLPNFLGKISWSSYQETDQGTPPTSPRSPKGAYNGLLVCEDSCNGMSFYCQENNKWGFETLANKGLTPIGILDGGYLAFTGTNDYTIHLKNLNTTNFESPVSLLQTIMREGRVINPDKGAIHYFCYSGRLYAILNLLVRSSSIFFLSFYYFDIVNKWSLLVDIPQEMDKQLFPGPFSSEYINVNLHSIPFDDNHIFLMAKLSLRNPAVGPLNWSGEQSSDGQPNMSMAETSICYLYKVDLCKPSSLLLTSRQVLSNTELNNAFCLKQKLCFPEEKLQEIGQQHVSDNLQIKCVCYDTISMEWCHEQLTLPLPAIEHLPLKQEGFPNTSVKVCGPLLYAGIHQAPYIFDVYMFTFDTFQWQKLPSIQSACFSPMVLYPISLNRPISHYMVSENSGKRSYNSEFRFLNSSLQSWKGNRNK